MLSCIPISRTEAGCPPKKTNPKEVFTNMTDQATKFTKGQWISFLCCCLLPLAEMAYGVIWLTEHVQFTFWFFLTFVIVPCVVVGLFAWVMFSRRHIGTKVLLSILIVVPSVLLFACLSIGLPYYQVVPYREENLQHRYSFVKKYSPMMPYLEELGEPEQIELYISSSLEIFYTGTAEHLVCRYESQEYENRKEWVETKYAFQTSEIYIDDDPYEYSTVVGDYTFRILDTEKYRSHYFDYPTQFILIGTSDEAREIVFMAFEDLDLDHIPSLGEFILDDCCWKYIR